MHLSTGDFLFGHPFGLDFVADILPDPPYSKLVRPGTAGSGEDPNSIGLEISQGAMPHGGPGLSDFLPGFLPVDGDRVAAVGHWIVDCGHTDFHTEMHPPTFLAFAHRQDARTTVSLKGYPPSIAACEPPTCPR